MGLILCVFVILGILSYYKCVRVISVILSYYKCVFVISVILCIMILVSETELPGIKKIKQEIKNSAQIMSTRNIYIDKKKECAPGHVI